MAIYDDVKITINLNELVEIRAKLISQYDDYSEKVNKGEYLDGGDIDRIATGLRDTLTWDTLYQMVDEAVQGIRNGIEPTVSAKWFVEHSPVKLTIKHDTVRQWLYDKARERI